MRIFPGSSHFQNPIGCVPAVLIVLLYAGVIIGGLWWLFHWVLVTKGT